jgi:hypothetical protein
MTDNKKKELMLEITFQIEDITEVQNKLSRTKQLLKYILKMLKENELKIDEIKQEQLEAEEDE